MMEKRLSFFFYLAIMTIDLNLFSKQFWYDCHPLLAECQSRIADNIINFTVDAMY